MTDEQEKKIDIDLSSEGSGLPERDFRDSSRERGRAARGLSAGLGSPGKIILWGGGIVVILLLLAVFFTGGRHAPGEEELAALQGRLEKIEGRLDALTSQSEEAIRYLREEVYSLTKKMEALEKKPETTAVKKVEKRESPAAGTITEKPKAAPAAVAEKQKAEAQKFHTVRKGDTLFGIARSYGLTVKELADLNGMPVNRTIHPGDQLRVH